MGHLRSLWLCSLLTLPLLVAAPADARDQGQAPSSAADPQTEAAPPPNAAPPAGVKKRPRIASGVDPRAAPVAEANPPPAPLDFDLLGPEAQTSPEETARREALQRALGKRRTLLTIHQAVGLALLGGMAATVVLGQLNYDDKYAGGGDTGKYITAHETVALATTVVFATAGLLALFAPSPDAGELSLDAQPQVSRSTLHKTAMAVATAGMAAEIVLGILSARSEGQLIQRNYALAHQINGYVTLGAVTAGFAVLTF